MSNCQRLDYPPALDLAKFLREQFPRVVRGAVTLVNNMAQTGPLRGVEEEFTRRPNEMVSNDYVRWQPFDAVHVMVLLTSK